MRPRFGKTRDIGLRSIVVVECDRIADSCGWSVPRMAHVEDRTILDQAQQRRDPSYYVDYAVTTNAVSIDGLPGLASC